MDLSKRKSPIQKALSRVEVAAKAYNTAMSTLGGAVKTELTQVEKDLEVLWQYKESLESIQAGVDLIVPVSVRGNFK